MSAIGDYVHLTWAGYNKKIESTEDKEPLFGTWNKARDKIQTEIKNKQKSNMLKVKSKELERKYNSFLSIAASGKENTKEEKEIRTIMNAIQSDLQEKIPLAVLKNNFDVDFGNKLTHHKIDLASSKKFNAIKITNNIQDLEKLVERVRTNLQKDSKRMEEIDKSYKSFLELKDDFIKIVNDLIKQTKSSPVILPSELKAFYIPLDKGKAKIGEEYDEKEVKEQLDYLKKIVTDEDVTKMKNFLKTYNNLIIALGHQNNSTALGEIGQIGAAKIAQWMGYTVKEKGQEGGYTALFDAFVYNPSIEKKDTKSWITSEVKISKEEREKRNLERRLKAFSDSQTWSFNGIKGKKMASLRLSTSPTQNKIDMTIQFEDNSKPIGVSIKNYDLSSSPGISVVTDSPLLFMVQALNTYNNFVNHWLNLTIYHNRKDGGRVSMTPQPFISAKNEANELMQQILFIQGLTGYKILKIRPTEEGKPSNKITFMDEPDLFLLFARNNGNITAKVIPIPTIIKEAIATENSFLISHYNIDAPPFSRSFSKQEVDTFNNSGEERISYILRAMRETKIHISLTSAFVKSKLLKT